MMEIKGTPITTLAFVCKSLIVRHHARACAITFLERKKNKKIFFGRKTAAIIALQRIPATRLNPQHPPKTPLQSNLSPASAGDSKGDRRGVCT